MEMDHFYNPITLGGQCVECMKSKEEHDMVIPASRKF